MPDWITISVSTAALIVSVIIAIYGWWRQRNIYDVERVLFFRDSQINQANNNDALRNKLGSGHYTILHTQDYGGYIEFILGKIKR